MINISLVHEVEQRKLAYFSCSSSSLTGMEEQQPFDKKKKNNDTTINISFNFKKVLAEDNWRVQHLLNDGRSREPLNVWLHDKDNERVKRMVDGEFTIS